MKHIVFNSLASDIGGLKELQIGEKYFFAHRDEEHGTELWIKHNITNSKFYIFIGISSYNKPAES